jgi:hypothetical protein
MNNTLFPEKQNTFQIYSHAQISSSLVVSEVANLARALGEMDYSDGGKKEALWKTNVFRSCISKFARLVFSPLAVPRSVEYHVMECRLIS